MNGKVHNGIYKTTNSLLFELDVLFAKFYSFCRGFKKHTVLNLKSISKSILDFCKGIILLPLFIVMCLVFGIIGVPFLFLLYSNLANKIRANKQDMVKRLQKMSFSKLKGVEKKIDSFLSKSAPIESDMKQLSRFFIFRSFAKNYIYIVTGFKELKQVCVNRYTYTPQDTGLNEQDFLVYQQSLAALQSIWEYPSTEKEQEMVFTQKKK